MDKDARIEPDTWGMEVDFNPRGQAECGKGWICVERFGAPLPILGDGFLGLELHDNSADNVRAVAEFLRNHVKRIVYTGTPRPEWIDQPGRGAVAKREADKVVPFRPRAAGGQ